MPDHPDWWMVSVAFVVGLLAGFHLCRRAVTDALDDYRRTRDANNDGYVRIPHPLPTGRIIPPQGGSGTAPVRAAVRVGAPESPPACPPRMRKGW